MKIINEFARLRALGLSLSKSWELAKQISVSVLDQIIFVLCFIALVTMLLGYLDEKYNKDYDNYYVPAMQYKIKSEKFEQIILGCLTNQGVVINRRSYECLIREYQ